MIAEPRTPAEIDSVVGSPTEQLIAAFEHVAGAEPIISAVLYDECGWNGAPREISTSPTTWSEACEQMRKSAKTGRGSKHVVAWTWTRVLMPVEKIVDTPNCDELSAHCRWCVALPRMPDRFMPPNLLELVPE